MLSKRPLFRKTVLLLVLATFVVMAAAPSAMSHAEGGIPKQLDTMAADALTHDATVGTAHGGLAGDHVDLGLEHVGLAGEHLAQVAQHASLAGEHTTQAVQHTALSSDVAGLATEHAAQSATLDSISAQVSAMSATLSGVAADVEDILDSVEVFDVEAVASAGGVVAGDPGEAPNNALVLARVTAGGRGVAGLTEGNVIQATRFVPAGGCSLEIDEFIAFGGGDYGFAVTPIDSAGCNWDAGDYLMSLGFQTADLAGSALVKITIPPASESNAEATAASASPTSTSPTQTDAEDVLWWIPGV